jgi:hypothetical protein
VYYPKSKEEAILLSRLEVADVTLCLEELSFASYDRSVCGIERYIVCRVVELCCFVGGFALEQFTVLNVYIYIRLCVLDLFFLLEFDLFRVVTYG